MTGTIDDRYLEWLYELVENTRNSSPEQSYWRLFRQLYTKEFIWLVPNDDNRIADGKELRHEFVTERGYNDVDPEWMDIGCSMLELLIALSRRASFESNKTPDEWFWILMHNVDLDGFTDDRYTQRVEDIVNARLEKVIFRTYNHSGRGGLFPLKRAHLDQRKVELWYQLAEYLLEEYPI